MKNFLNQTSKNLLLLLVFLFTITVLKAQYTLTDDDVIVENGFIKKCITDTSHWGTTSIIIPPSLHSTIITGIDTGVFESKNITEVALPASLKYLGRVSFYDNNMKTLVIPERVKIIADFAFSESAFDSIVIPSNVNIIKYFAFNLDRCLLTFEEGSNIRALDEYAFGWLNQRVKLPSNKNYGFNGYIDEEGTRYEVGLEFYSGNFKRALFADIPTRILTADDVNLVNGKILRSQAYLTYCDIIIPSEVNDIKITTITDKAFEYVFLNNVIIEDGITSIGKNAFYYNFIKKLELPNTISVIKDSCFSHNLFDTIIIPTSVSKIEHSAFSGFPGTSVVNSKAVFLPNGLEYLGESCFANSSFSNVMLPSSLSYIGPYAFKKYLDSLDITINLPNPVIKEGFEFSHWENAKGDTVAIIDDHTTSYTAMFTETQNFTVSGTVAIDEPQGLLFELSGDFERIYHANDDGTFKFPLNAGRTITVKPLRTGYTFTPDSISITDIQSDLSGFNFTAVQNNYSIRFKSGENGTITGENLQTVGYKQLTSEVKAVGNNGYIFKYWIASNRELLSTDNPITLKLTKDIELEAVFDIGVGAIEKPEVSIKCFPNPAKNSLNIEAPGLISKVELYNTLGQKVYQKEKINAKLLNINVTDFTKGIYIVNISGNEFSQVIKVMVK